MRYEFDFQCTTSGRNNWRRDFDQWWIYMGFHFILPLFRNPGSWIRATIVNSDCPSLYFFWHHLLYLTSIIVFLLPFYSHFPPLFYQQFSTKITPKLRKQFRSMTTLAGDHVEDQIGGHSKKETLRQISQAKGGTKGLAEYWFCLQYDVLEGQFQCVV